jgi:uncharacterized phage protein (TIGR02218 family)
MRTLHADVITEIGQPAVTFCYILELTLSGGSALRYTDWEENLVVDSDTYYSRGMEFGQAGMNTTLATDPITITLDNVDAALAAAAVANDLRGGGMVLQQVFLNAAGAVIGDPVMVWSGTCAHTELDEDDCKVHGKSQMAKLDRTCPRRIFDKSCPWVFGDSDCAFDASTTQVTAQTCDAGATASEIADAARTEADDYWKDGILTMTSGATSGQVRRVLSSASGTVTLEHALSAAPAAGDGYTLQQGCDQSWNTCDSRFSNTDNFGGFVSLAEQIVKY